VRVRVSVRVRVHLEAVQIRHDRVVQAQLHGCHLEHALLVRLFGQQAIHHDSLILSDPVRARLRLQVVLWVPVAVVNNHRVGCCKVNTDAARPSRQQHDEQVRVWAAVSINSGLPLLPRDRSINALVGVSAQLHVVLEEIQHNAELRENKHSMPVALQLGQELVKQHHLTRCLSERLYRCRIIEVLSDLSFCTFDEEWVVAALADFHSKVSERGHLFRACLAEEGRIHLIDSTVVLLLWVGELYLDNNLFFGWYTLLHRLFFSAQQVRTDLVVQISQLGGRLQIAELCSEVVFATEGLVVDKVKQRPQFFGAILQRGARQQQAVGVPELVSERA